MSALRKEADEAVAQNEELKSKVKQLEQENLAKEQEITSLSHKNQVLEKEVETLEESVSKHKGLADESSQHGVQNESLTRRLQVLEDEAEQADRTLRETNEKYVSHAAFDWLYLPSTDQLLLYHL
jgi:tropomyosin, fungi type